MRPKCAGAPAAAGRSPTAIGGKGPRLLPSRAVVAPDFIPIYNVPPSFDIVCPSVLVFQIISMLPDIKTHDSLSAGHQRIVLVWRGFNGELAVLDDHPSPTRAESAHAGLCEFRFEIGE